MYIVAIAWMFVVVLMAAAEAMSGAIWGALGTLILYGILPLSIVMYLLATPLRRRRRAQQEAVPAATEPVVTAEYTPPPASQDQHPD